MVTTVRAAWPEGVVVVLVPLGASGVALFEESQATAASSNITAPAVNTVSRVRLLAIFGAE